MFIRIGFEIALDCSTQTTLILALSPHSSYRGRVIGSYRLRTEPELPLEEFLDPFGNRLTRLVAPPGDLTLWSDCIVEDDGQPDIYNWNALQHAPADLPPETLPFLTASRYCEADVLREEAWKLFGESPLGWARVQAICNFVHNHLSFGYGFGRPTKTAGDALRERTGVCRDFAHLSIALCRAMSIPARYASGYLGDIGVPPSGAGDFWPGSRPTSVAAGTRSTPATTRLVSVAFSMVRGRDAADGAMMTTFGASICRLFRVWTEEVLGVQSDAALRDLLSVRPDTEALTLAPVDARAHLEGNVF